ncbi:hypothetical protein DSO57_1022895 [Entomophthora muscae]|uniref:Uncharacterized protein n=1 Tax=Entomophthora muscae TaxID=34485 RepID=A0ACC2T337_9FUNG|nr:hypothetical protein DSO57_1022895 [Entomophthora muscae]
MNVSLLPSKEQRLPLPNPLLWKENLKLPLFGIFGILERLYDSENSWVPHYNCSNSSDLIHKFYKHNPTAIGHPELTLAAMKLPPAHKNFSLSHLPDVCIVPRAKAEVNDTVGSIMSGISQPSYKA